MILSSYPVSYTHLDVYKRQYYDNLCTSLELDDLEINIKLIVFKLRNFIKNKFILTFINVIYIVLFHFQLSPFKVITVGLYYVN